MIDGKRSSVQRMVYALGNVMGVAMAVYKCQVMGLLPTHASDWLAFVEPQKVCKQCDSSVSKRWFRTQKVI